jgi:integrase/recombinase XerD
VQAFPVRLPSGTAYWTVLDDDLELVAEADAYLHQLRFGRDGAESTTAAYARALALYLEWCARTGQHWTSAERLGAFMTWLQKRGRGPGRARRPGWFPGTPAR